MSYETILVETRGRVGVIRLNRPQALNALNSALNAELGLAIAACDADLRAIVCILLTARNQAFAAGGRHQGDGGHDRGRRVHGRLCRHLARGGECAQADRCGSGGFALGGGCELACSATLIIAPTPRNSASPRSSLASSRQLGGTSA